MIVLSNVESNVSAGGLYPGGRFSFGYWQVEDNPWIKSGIRDLGVETIFFFLPQASVSLATGDRTPTLAVPFFDINDRVESAFIVASPGISTGNVSAFSQANLWGMEANAWKNLYCSYPGTDCTVSVMGGFRFLDADLLLRLHSTSVFAPTIDPTSEFASFAGNRLEVMDTFSTHNRFYGPQIGIDNRNWLFEKFYFDVAFKLAFGVTTQDLNIVGNQLRTFADGTTAVSTGGLFALTSNIGHYHRDKFTPLPEINFQFGGALTQHLTLTLGFSALYWDRFLRPGLQIQREIDITQIPNFPPALTATPTGLGNPSVPMRQADLWVMGITFGLEFKW
jgi:hypothetical protein